MKKILLLLVGGIMLPAIDLYAQCAMCRSTLENNLSNGNPGIAAGINTGILYLLVIPYIAVMVLGYMWYKTSKNAKNDLRRSLAAK
ncbi:MAG TPA: hypothetical protein VD884_02675 [Ohtaekwangia sp.]|nr:hypothetical protein [Ohtaekwangia sp.]